MSVALECYIGGGPEPAWLPPLVVELIHHDQIEQHGGRPGLRDRGLLEAALARPRSVWAYGDDPDLADLAAAHADAILRDPPFVDGNKRTPLMAVYTLLALNERELDAPEPETVAVMRALSAGDLAEEAFAAWLREHTTPAAESSP